MSESRMDDDSFSDPLLSPYTNLNDRKIEIQDDKYRGWLLAIYCSVLLIGLPIWWYCTNVPSVSIPTSVLADIQTHLQQNQEFVVNLYSEEQVIVDALVVNGYSFKFKRLGAFDENSVLDNDTPFTINLIISNENVPSIVGKRTIVIKDSGEIETVLSALTRIEFPIPKLKKSKIKLKFSFLTTGQDEEEFKWDFFDNFHNFLSLLDPVLSFDSSFHVKYIDQEMLEDSEITAEMFIGSDPIVNLNSGDDRGRGDIFNFIVLRGQEEKMLFIKNWGIILQITNENEARIRIGTIFLNSMRKLLGFPEELIKFNSELVEIDFWMQNVKKYYLSECEGMISKLIQANTEVVIRPEIYRENLLVAWKNLLNPTLAYDLIESAYHDPKLIAASYFPDEHKFAVYLPVYLPLILPILVALLAYINEWRRDKSKLKSSDKLKTQ